MPEALGRSGMGLPVGTGDTLGHQGTPVGTALTVTGNVTPSYCRFTTATDTAGMCRSSCASGSVSAGSTSARAGRRGDIMGGDNAVLLSPAPQEPRHLGTPTPTCSRKGADHIVGHHSAICQGELGGRRVVEGGNGKRTQVSWHPHHQGPTCQRPSGWRRRRCRGAWQRSSTPRGRRKAARAWARLSIPPRSDHWLQRSARARWLSPDSAPRSFPAGDNAGVPSCHSDGIGVFPHRVPPAWRSPEPSASPSRTDRRRRSASKSAGKQERMLSARQSPANTPRHRLSTAMSATCRDMAG